LDRGDSLELTTVVLTLSVCAASPAGSISAVNVMMAAEMIRDFILVVLPD